MDGYCDVPECTNKTYMGWRPRSERLGKQICEDHWGRHKDPEGSLDLFEVFGFRRPVRIPKPVAKKEVGRCACGRKRLPGHKFCTDCAAERERERKREAYHKRKDGSQQEPAEQAETWRCRDCGGPRQAGHTYCLKCAQRREKHSNRERRRQCHRRTQKKRVGLM
ncbi:MAG: hypothetical protein ACYST6_04500 [Planctomycetota bacterium]